MENQKIVVRYKDGRLVKGTTINFSPTARFFHLFEHGQSSQTPNVVDTAALKAVFFVRTFEGDSNREDRNHFVPGDQYGGSQVEVNFCDGEKLVGTTPNYDQSATGFFVFPVDKNSNTIKVFAVNSAVTAIRFIKPMPKKLSSLAGNIPHVSASQSPQQGGSHVGAQQGGKICPPSTSNAQFNQPRKGFIQKMLDMFK